MTADRERLRVAVLSNDPQRNARLTQLLGTLGFVSIDIHNASVDAVDLVVAAADDHTEEALEHLLRTPSSPSLVVWGEPVAQRHEVCGWLPLQAPAEAVRLALTTAWELSRARKSQSNGGTQPARSEAANGDMERLKGLASLGEAALQLNHDINNPLCSISLNAQLLLMSLDGRLEDSALDKIRSIETNADRIRELTENLSNAKRRSVKEPSQSFAEVPV